MNIIGLGNAGCQVAKNFEKYDQYRVFCIDMENKGYGTFIPVKEQISHEDYEKNYKKLNLAKCKGPTTLILNGIGNISGCALRLLEQIRENPIEIIYIKSDESSFTDDLKKRGRTTLGVLQEYTRSAVFDIMYIISNEKIEKVIFGVKSPEHIDSIVKDRSKLVFDKEIEEKLIQLYKNDFGLIGESHLAL